MLIKQIKSNKERRLTWSCRCASSNRCRGAPGDICDAVPLDKRVAYSPRFDERALPRSMVLSPLYALVNDSESSPRPPHNASVILRQRTFVVTTFLDIVHFDLISSSLFRQVAIVLNLIYSWFFIYRSFASRSRGWSVYEIISGKRYRCNCSKRFFFFFYLPTFYFADNYFSIYQQIIVVRVN